MECVICFSPYDEGRHRPLCLPCGHSVCQECVADMCNRSRSFLCPSCRLEISDKTLEDFPVNFSLIGTSSACKLAAEEKKEEEIAVACDSHPSKKVKFHCSHCKQDFCSKCVVKHTGDNHKIEDLSLAVDRQLDLLLLEARRTEAELLAITDKIAEMEGKTADMKEIKKTLGQIYSEAMERIKTEQEEIYALLDKAVEDNSALLDSAKREIEKQHKAFTETQSLLRNARHSVAKGHEKRASLSKVDTALEQIWDKEAGALRQFKLSNPTLWELTHTNLPGRIAELAPLEEKSPAAVPQPIAEAEEAKSAPSLPNSKLLSKASLPREPAAKAKPRPKGSAWHYMSDGNSWIPYSAAQNRQIEDAFQAKSPTVDLGKHLIDFVTMTQTNKATKKARKVGREIPAN